MRPHQARVRTMRKHGRKHGRSTDGIRQTYYDERIHAAKGAVRVTTTPEQENKS